MVITNHGLFPNATPRHPPTPSGKSRVQPGSPGSMKSWGDVSSAERNRRKKATSSRFHNSWSGGNFDQFRIDVKHLYGLRSFQKGSLFVFPCTRQACLNNFFVQVSSLKWHINFVNTFQLIVIAFKRVKADCWNSLYQPVSAIKSAYKSPCFAMFLLPPGCHPRIRLSQAVDAGLGFCLGHAVRAPRAPFPGILHTFFGIFRGLSMGLL